MRRPWGAAAHPLVYWALAGLLFWLFLRWFERVNLYFPTKTIAIHPGTYGLKYEELRVQAEDGPEIHGWYVENKPESPVMLVSHGNAGNIGDRLDKLLIFRGAGASVLFYDYRGYGRSSGRPSEEGTYRDAEAAYRWLTEVKKIPPRRIIFYGESLGCAVALELALRHEPAGLILESGFTSTAEMARLLLPFLPVNWLVRFRYDNLSKIAKLHCPLLIMHSPQDDIVPYAMGRRNFAAAPEPKSFFELKGGHNEGFLDSGAPYEEAISRFLARCAAR
jgi:fermentation-respiration switch protein FrsA (DUF1100 family)